MINRIINARVATHIQTTYTPVKKACEVASGPQNACLALVLCVPSVVQCLIRHCGPHDFLHDVCCYG